MIDLKRMSVLIVDDMENMCRSIRGMLKVLNYGSVFQFASNGLEGLTQLQKKPTDLAIIDWNMPGMTGIELLEHIREDKDLRDMSVIMVTAEANREIVAESAESDIDAYLLKPLTVKSLGDKISIVIEKVNNPPPMFYHLKLARDFEEAGDIEAAITETKHAMEADPLSTRPMRELGKIHLERNEYDEAEKWLTKATDMNKLDVIAFHHLGELYLKQNDIEKAAEFYDKAMNISPRHVTRGVNFGKALVQKGMINKAQQVFERAIELSSNSLRTHEDVADYCMESGVNEYAGKLMEFVLEQAPNREDVIYKLGVINENLGQPRKALSYFIEAGKKNCDDVDIQLKIAKNYVDTGQVLRAEQIIDTVLKKDPENQGARELLRHCL